MPMSDQGDRLRLGVAVNALRAALRIYTPQTHPAQWASTQINLANALQYLPSVHQEQNLDEAVHLYEEVLQHRDPVADPLGYASILSNQGNALGHLGVFADARERLSASTGHVRVGRRRRRGPDRGRRSSPASRRPQRPGDGVLMEMYARAHFDILLREAAGNFAERCVHRAGGVEPALIALRQEAGGIGLTDFVNAFFSENLLEDAAGSCFVLEALERRSLPADPGGQVTDVLARLARAAFADVLATRRRRSSSSSRSTPRRTTVDTASFDELAARVDELRDQVNHSDESARALLQETLDAITEFNRQGLITLVHMMREDERAAEILYASVDYPEVMALFVSHGIIRSDRTLDVLQVYEQIRPHLIAGSIEMSVEEVRDDVAFVKFATGCSAPEQSTKDEIMGIIRQRVTGLRDVVEVAQETSSAFVAVDTIRVGPPA